MIRVEKITKYYPTRKGLHYVLKDASVEIPSGAQVGVVGRNGAGKSTLMRMLAGVDVPNRGRITKWGTVSWPLGIASCVQGQLTGRENTRFVCRIQGLHHDEMEPIVEFVQSFAEIGDYFDEPARVYSSGMKARLGFGITMAFDFDFYIIDELSAVGDASFKQKAKQLFKEKRLKAGFVRTSHSVSELRAECDSGIVINDAKLEYWPTIDGAIERYMSLVGLAKEEDGEAEDGKKAAKGRRRDAPASQKRNAKRFRRDAKRQTRTPAPDRDALSRTNEGV